MTFETLKNFFKGDLPDEWKTSALIECADGFWDYNLANSTLFISPKLKDLMGYSKEDYINLSLDWWIGKVHPQDQDAIRNKIEDLKAAQTEWAFTEAFRFASKNGDYLWLENHLKILRDEKGALLRLGGVITNMTSQKFVEDQLRNLVINQEKSAQNKMRFLTALNHDLRSPLSGIIGMAGLLKETNLSSEQSHYIDNIINSSEMLLKLVNEILDVSKLTSGKFQFEKIRFSLAQVAKQASDLIRPSLIRKKLAFHTSIDNSLPEFLMGDPTRLQQILVNLLSNAVKFTLEGKIVLTIKKVLAPLPERDAYRVHFEISDTGIGIAPETQGRLFEDFIQANSSIARMYGGTGLGLSICKELVQLMGGEIGVKSDLGKGSTFWFNLSMEGEKVPVSEKVLQAPLSKPAPLPVKLTILLVEDNRVNQEVMTGLLHISGDDVIVANNGVEAIEVFQTQKFDMVLMDLNMPVMDGLTAAKAIRALPNGASIPIIAVTANTYTGNLDNCLLHGITNVLNKPIDKASLQKILSPYRQPSLKENTMAAGSFPTAPPLLLINEKAFKTLIQDLGKETIARLLGTYQEEGSLLIVQLKKCAPPDCKKFAHTLAGMSENMGFAKVGRIARDIMEGDENDGTAFPLLLEKLEDCFKKSQDEAKLMMAL